MDILNLALKIWMEASFQRRLLITKLKGYFFFKFFYNNVFWIWMTEGGGVVSKCIFFYITLVAVMSCPSRDTRTVIKPDVVCTGTAMLARESCTIVFVWMSMFYVILVKWHLEIILWYQDALNNYTLHKITNVL